MTIAALFLALIATPNLDQSRLPVLLDFQADWCGPCRQMRPAVKQLIDNGYPVKEIDVDQSPEVAARYGVKGVPTFIVVDSAGTEIARTSGYQPVRELASFYLKAKAQAKPQGGDDSGAEQPTNEERVDPKEPEPTEPEEPAPTARGVVNPEPWKTVVRIKVRGNGSIGFGSGTIIHSTAEESIILTCAHVFKVEGRPPTHPSRFPLPIDVDLFDGVLQSQKEPRVHFLETVKGEAIDYDFDRDVGLIRIRPGRRLPASRVVPESWKARPRTKMTTVGCSEGHDATAWTTFITKPGVALFQNSVYEANECQYAPKQGRSGGGLYTEDGYLAGVCDFAEPQGNRGYYATPRSIYHILNRNRLTALYKPVDQDGGALLADRRPAPRRTSPPSIARAQSPDTEDSKISIPPPGMLGIQDPMVAQNERPRAASNRRAAAMGGWRSVPTEGETAPRSSRRTESAEMFIAPDASNDTFDTPSKPSTAFVPERREPSTPRSKSQWKPIQSPTPMISAASDR